MYLDPFNAQTGYSGKLLELFNYNVDNDQAYVERLKRHYAMFKESLKEENQSTRSPLSGELTRVESIPADKISISGEARYIVQCGVACDARVVSLMGLVFFSTETGDAWMLDIQDGYAMCLAHGGDPLDYSILETDTKVEIPWDSQYRIEGERFIVDDGDGKITEYLGYPVQAIAQAAGASATRTLIPNKTQQFATSRRANAISKAEKTCRKRMRKLNQKKRK